MLSIGGRNPSQQVIAETDNFPNGLGVFDMTELSWVNSYNPDAASYEQPDIVKQYYASK